MKGTTDSVGPRALNLVNVKNIQLNLEFQFDSKLDLKTKENFNSRTFLCLFNKFLKKMLIGSLEAI